MNSLNIYQKVFLDCLRSKFKVQNSALRNAKLKLTAVKNPQSNFQFRTTFPRNYKNFLNLKSNMSTPAVEKSSCIFCNIVNKFEETEILYEDEEVCIFRDIKPASLFHILTIPKRHIEDVKSLTSSDKDLVQHMLLTSQELLTKNNLSLTDARFGYHWPPFRSVKHLHLHTIAPESQMGIISRMVFKTDSYWFVSPDYVASRL